MSCGGVGLGERAHVSSRRLLSGTEKVTPLRMKCSKLLKFLRLPPRFLYSLRPLTITLGALALLGGCASVPQLRLPPPLRVSQPSHPDTSSTLLKGTKTSSKQRFHATPRVPPLSHAATQAYHVPNLVPQGGKPVKLNLLSMPLPAFINEVYGNLLHLDFQISQPLVKRNDLVTLRVTRSIVPAELYRLANQILRDYGVASHVQGKHLLRFSLAKAEGGERAPLLVSGMTLPSVPINNRPMFQLVSLAAVSNVSISGWLQQIYKGMSLKVRGVPSLNAVLLEGPPIVVRQAVSAIHVLDQPAMRGRHSVRIEPAFLTAKHLAQALIKALQAEGYSASSTPPIGAVQVIPIQADNSVLVFAASSKILRHVEQWAQSLDHPPQNTGSKGLYFYQVKNTAAVSLMAIVAPLIGGQANGAVAGVNNRPGSSFSTRSSDAVMSGLGNRRSLQPLSGPRPAGVTQTVHGTGGQRLVVDSLNNSLIYQGSASRWAQLRPVLTRLDVPPRMVLVQVMVAEVTLTNASEFGVEWALRKAGIGGFSGKLSTLGGLGLGSSGLNYYPLSQSGQTMAVLNAFASSNRVTVLSSPALMVESGQEASINVGSKVPTLASNTLASIQQGGSSAIIQQIQYLSTGVMMQIQPIVHSGGRVNIHLTVSVSSALPTNSSKIDSPTISDRQVETTLSLKDGGSVLIGGLMTTNNSKGNSRVPLLGNIPLLGNLFRNNSRNRTHSELMILIIPYIVSTNREARHITDEFIRQAHMQTKNLPQRLHPDSKTAVKKLPPAADTPGMGEASGG